MEFHVKISTFLMSAIALASSFSAGQSKFASSRHTLPNVKSEQPYVLMNANNLTSWVRGDGFYNWLVKQSWNGEFPKGSGVGTVFSEGIVFGGKVHDGLYADSIRVTGDTYAVGMAPGAIISDAAGNTTGADDPSSSSSRAFAVRPDMPASIQHDTASWPDLTMDAATFFQKNKDSVTTQDINAVAAQYFKDWTEWPSQKGAPWYVDNEGIVRNDAAYDPTNPHDIPGIPGAAKSIWYVCNDQDKPTTASFAGSPPLGIEEQVTLWAYNETGIYAPLNDAIFKQVKLIYKGNPGAPANASIDSLYFCQWVDTDIGDPSNNLGGCDTMLNLGYAFSATTNDSVFASVGLTSPATGYAYLVGSAYFTGNATDSAIVNFHWRKGYHAWYQRPMTVFFLHQTGTPISDPDIGPYTGTLQWFNVMRGDLTRPQYPAGTPFWKAYWINNFPTQYTYCGDPVSGKGWIDGVDNIPGDRRFWSSHGPVHMNLHDTAEVVIAHVEGMGASNLTSISVMKYNLSYAQFVFNTMAAPSSVATGVEQSGIPSSFEVSQNYPNPFNPSTTIRYQLPSAGKVTMKIFNLLGQEVAIIVDEVKQTGQYSTVWNARNIPSGVYFCRTEVHSLGGSSRLYSDVKKLILLK